MYGIDTIRKLNETLTTETSTATTTTTTTAAPTDPATAESTATFVTSSTTGRQQTCTCETKTSTPSSGLETRTVKEVSLEDWNAEVIATPLPVVVDFYANWCRPCDQVTSIIGHLAGEFGNVVKFAKVDVDKNLEIADRYNVRSIPIIIIFRSGKELARTTGTLSKEELMKLIATQISMELGGQNI